MLAKVLWVTSILAGVVVAQNKTSTETVPAFVDLNQKVQWCNAQRQTCLLLCGGREFTTANDCNGLDIPDYTCTCSNGEPPANIEEYLGSVPHSICLANFKQCRDENPGSDNCPVCGELDPKDAPERVVSSTVASSASATPTSTDASADTAAAASPTGSPGAAAPVGRVSAVGGCAVAVVAALGVLL